MSITNDIAARSRIEIESVEQAGSLKTIVATAANVPLDHARDLIERGGAWVDRLRVRETDRWIDAGSRLVIHFPPQGRYDTITIAPADLIWEDAALLALNKRPGWYANATPWDVYGALPHALAAYLHTRDGQPVDLHFPHQLDRDTSGVLLVSKKPAINAGLQRLFLTHTISKSYLALVAGRVEQPVIEVETGHGRGQYGLFRVYPLDQIGRELPFGAGRVRHMHTRFEVLARHNQATLVRATPITGRTHQIRLHAQHLGHPIAGDVRYGGPTTLLDQIVPHHVLHAARLHFPHPITHVPTTITAPLPGTWHSLLVALGFDRLIEAMQNAPASDVEAGAF